MENYTWFAPYKNPDLFELYLLNIAYLNEEYDSEDEWLKENYFQLAFSEYLPGDYGSPLAFIRDSYVSGKEYRSYTNILFIATASLIKKEGILLNYEDIVHAGSMRVDPDEIVLCLEYISLYFPQKGLEVFIQNYIKDLKSKNVDLPLAEIISDSVEIYGDIHLQGIITIIHELAHMLMHRSEFYKDAKKEPEADIVTYLVCRYFGINLLKELGYFNFPINGKGIVKNMGRITYTAKNIIRKLEKELELFYPQSYLYEVSNPNPLDVLYTNLPD